MKNIWKIFYILYSCLSKRYFPQSGVTAGLNCFDFRLSGETTFVTLKVYNDIAAELSMAVLKYLKRSKTPDEEIMYRCVKSLVKFCVILRQDLMSCIAMVGVDLDSVIPGSSDRVDELWEQLRAQLLASN